MATEENPLTKFTPQRKTFDWFGFAKKTGIVLGTGALFGALGYGAYTTVSGQALNNVRAMGFRVGAQFAIVAVGLSYWAVASYGTPAEMYERYKTTGKFFSDRPQAQIALARHHHD